jgi:cytochrome c oxidase cbb3-type subunit 3
MPAAFLHSRHSHSHAFRIRAHAAAAVALTLALVLAAPVAAAQGLAANPGQLPSADKMLNVPVGGTHIPHERTPADVANPYEGNADALVQGRALFKSMNCIGCHASHGGGGIGPALSDQNWIYGGEPGQIFLTIKQGRPNGMPSFASLPDDSIWKLVTYVRTLSKPESGPVPQSPPPKETGKP